ncbi:hypothetical protein D9758_000558 [Tetrapyrgos nigripes]|uniref:Uncharacterized protein n=1 Tax=Tetrapyrgos nigripes TaxID=182062 RepID=A0A8H5LZK7_9AGAR|nr:hypothetical protein D9758_000558 [Tetrapyrgos nigripes]
MSCTILQPRPYAQLSGKLLLLPLLHSGRTFDFPSELWERVFELGAEGKGGRQFLQSLLVVSKRFKDIALPLFHSSACITTLSSLQSFWKHLHAADRKHDSIRRIPYSAPGRWVKELDLRNIPFTSRGAALEFDEILTNLFPVLPFLSSLRMNPSFVLSRRAIAALVDNAVMMGGSTLRKLEGISYVPQNQAAQCLLGNVPQCQAEEPLVQLLRYCPLLEQLEVIGRGHDPTELDFLNSTEVDSPHSLNYSSVGITSLNLPALQTLTVLSNMHSSILLLTLLLTPLPSLKKLTITPYDDVPFPHSLNTQFILTHGSGLATLALLAPNFNEWPRRIHKSPSMKTLLAACPRLKHLGLENPLPDIDMPSSPASFSSQVHQLEILSLPRPNAAAYTMLVAILPCLPSLRTVRARDVRWLRKGMGLRALETGVQGEMREWRRRLARRGVRVVDGEWKDAEE